MAQFKAGDRVRVYGAGPDLSKATVDEITEDGTLDVIFDGEDVITGGYHPKQCRRLVKRKHREWILQGHPSACVSSYVHKPIVGPELAMDEQVRVREVKVRK